MKTNWNAKKIFTLEFLRYEKAIRNKMANKLYYFIKNLPNFPVDESAATMDKRKFPTPPYHLYQKGAGFVGSERRVGPHFSGDIPKYKEGTVSIVFSSKKQQKHRVFDYAGNDKVGLQDLLYLHPTRSEVAGLLKQAIAEVSRLK